MADATKTPEPTPELETEEVDTNIALEQGLGVGARELASIGESGAKGTLERDDDVDGDTIRRDTAVQGTPDGT
ncbi:MAG: hypothetical protein KKA16_06515 [Alphaproteobacteria bacterium]|nr:hypothetical protein [Alphaproteobacteria bacterium]MBU2378431.1 hypothetical protein [Alphaproteobacteria bacterium]